MSEDKNAVGNGNCNQADQGSVLTKLSYQRPSLTIFGSVRELTGSGSGSGGDNGMPMASDASIKTNVVQIGEHPAGFGLYLFDYLPKFRDAFGHGRQFGVIANEVEQIIPQAVTFASDGIRRVNYGMIGITRH